ncbi:hypothetical protein FHT86_006375 [Rhizobium sp. BK313]|nr:hypothetical protein [Rhizobium sp. BK313]
MGNVLGIASGCKLPRDQRTYPFILQRMAALGLKSDPP